jgi:BA14K-like protein
MPDVCRARLYKQPSRWCGLELITEKRGWRVSAARFCVLAHSERTMRWIVFVLWLLLTPIWISYSSSAGSGPKVAFIPPALVLIALLSAWLWKRLVVRIAGEFEPSYFHPHWGSALPLRGYLRIALVAVAVGVCVGAVVGQSTFDTAVFKRSATRPANQANLPISVQTETAKSQSFSAEPKAADPTLIVRTEPVKSPVQPTSSDNPGAKRPEAQMSISGQSSSDQPRCDVWLCERYYRSFRVSDCTYQPYGGPRQYCTR